jgi:hypothetical protein
LITCTVDYLYMYFCWLLVHVLLLITCTCTSVDYLYSWLLVHVLLLVIMDNEDILPCSVPSVCNPCRGNMDKIPWSRMLFGLCTSILLEIIF